MSAINSMLVYLATNKQVTTAQARSMFKVNNVADVVYRLRNEGFSIYTNRVVNSRGKETFAYRWGTPSNSFQKNLNSRHKARARKALYNEAIASNG